MGGDESEGYTDDEFEDDHQLVAKPMFAAKDDDREEEDDGDDEEEELDDEEEDDEGDEDSDDEREQIKKLRVANEALRKQIKHFQKVFEATMNKTARETSSKQGGGTLRGPDPGKKSLRALVASKQKQVENLKKKIEMYKKSNGQLKRQVQQAFSSDRVVQMGNENKEKEKQIQTLIEQNRNLLALQRSQAKKMNKAESDWPARISTLQDELRVARESLRKYKEKSKNVEEENRKQREVILKLQDKQKRLAEELKRYEESNGKIVKPRQTLDLESHQSQWDEERRKLEKKLAVLEKSNKMERIKAANATKQAEHKVKEQESQLDKLRATIEEKEKDLRYSVVQIKKLKRGLRDLALGDTPLPSHLTDQPWSANMSKFLNGVEIQDDEDEEETTIILPGSPVQQNSPQAPPIKAPTNRGPRIAKQQEEEEQEEAHDDDNKQHPVEIPQVDDHPEETKSFDDDEEQEELEQTSSNEQQQQFEEEQQAQEQLEEVQQEETKQVEEPERPVTPPSSSKIEHSKTQQQQPKSAFAKPMMGGKKKKKKAF